MLHRLLYDAGVEHEYRLVRGADHVGESIPPRVRNALRFVGRYLRGSLGGGAMTQEVSLESHFGEYIEGFGPESDIEAVVSQYWSTNATVFAPGQAFQLSTPADIVAFLTASMSPVIEAGWQGSSMVAFSSCRLGGGVALVGLDYQRTFADGHTTTDSATYVTLRDGDSWKIAGVMASDEATVRC